MVRMVSPNVLEMMTYPLNALLLLKRHQMRRRNGGDTVGARAGRNGRQRHGRREVGRMRRELGLVQSRRQVEEALHLNSIPRTHVTNVVEIRRCRYHLRPTIVVPATKHRFQCWRKTKSGSRSNKTHEGFDARLFSRTENLRLVLGWLFPARPWPTKLGSLCGTLTASQTA